MKYCLSLIVALVFSVTLAVAQDIPKEKKQKDEPETGRFNTELRFNGWWFGNFFQAYEGSPEEDVMAGSVEGRFMGKLGNLTPYVHANYLQYDDSELDNSYGGRAGARWLSRPHDLDLFVDHQLDRPTFDIGDTFDRADVTRFVADYKLRVFDDWQVGVEGEMQTQSYDETVSKDNDFTAVGASLRWRASRLFSPEIGYIAGERDVDNEVESYDQTDTYLQVRSAPTEALYLSARYRMRQRDYITPFQAGDPIREDDRDQWTVSADLRTGDRLTWNFYYAMEDTDSNLEGRDFSTSLALLGLTIGF